MKLGTFVKRLGAVVACSLAAPLLAVAAQGDPASYPSRSVRVLTPAAPGGTTDFLARLFSNRLSETLKQQFIVDNRASASGVLAAELTANAAPDGYTLFLAYHQHTINAALLPKLPYHAVNDFTPITQLTSAGLMLVIHPSSPPKTFKEFMEWTKTYKGGLNFGSAGIGSGGHLAGELYKLMTGVKATHIPYKGTGPATTALLGTGVSVQLHGTLVGHELRSERPVARHRRHVAQTSGLDARHSDDRRIGPAGLRSRRLVWAYSRRPSCRSRC